MIVTEQQYIVTQDRVQRFTLALAKVENDDTLRFRDLQIRSIQDQIEALEDDLDAYDRLVSGDVETIIVERVADLPRALIQARLVAGIEQRGLAQACGLPFEKIRRWESDGYSRASLKSMQRIASVLPLKLAGSAASEAASVPRDIVRRSLRNAGLAREVFDCVIDPHDCEDFARDGEIDRRLKTLFGIGAAAFATGSQFAPFPLRFKLPKNAAQDRTRAYAAYVDGLCSIVATTQDVGLKDLPSSWQEVRRVLFPTGEVELEIAVRRCWAIGIGVLALRDPVAFHGACRRSEGRATIVLKQSSRHHSRWLFDLVHEIFHLIAEPGDFTLLEAAETAPERRSAQIEKRANRFAALVLTGGALASALAEVAKRAAGEIARLPSAVSDVARSHDVPVGILANLVAENVQINSRRNWWGAAENLQPEDDDPWKAVRDIFIEEANFGRLDATQSALLRQALETSDE